jgi:hypothetical protein
MTSTETIKRDIDQVIENREARVAILCGESIRTALDMLDVQPAAVLEVLLEHAKRLQLSGNAPKHRYKLRAAIIEYLEERRHEAQRQEHRLAQAISGVPNE